MAQLKRYLAGAKLSEEALEALESHLVECADCQRLVQSQKNQPAASPSTPTHAVVDSPAPTASPFAVAKKKTFKLHGNAKTLALSGALALVLIAMSALAKDPTKLFGERVATPATPVAKAETPKAIASASADKPAEEPEAKEPVQVEKAPEVNASVPPAQTPASKPITAPDERTSPPVRRARAAAQRPQATRRASAVRRAPQARTPRASVPAQQAKRPASQPPASGIAVYDESGKRVR